MQPRPVQGLAVSVSPLQRAAGHAAAAAPKAPVPKVAAQGFDVVPLQPKAEPAVREVEIDPSEIDSDDSYSPGPRL